MLHHNFNNEDGAEEEEESEEELMAPPAGAGELPENYFERRAERVERERQEEARKRAEFWEEAHPRRVLSAREVSEKHQQEDNARKQAQWERDHPSPVGMQPGEYVYGPPRLVPPAPVFMAARKYKPPRPIREAPPVPKDCAVPYRRPMAPLLRGGNATTVVSPSSAETRYIRPDLRSLINPF